MPVRFQMDLWFSEGNRIMNIKHVFSEEIKTIYKSAKTQHLLAFIKTKKTTLKTIMGLPANQLKFATTP